MIGERCLALADFDVIQDAPVSGFINHRADHDARFFRIADAQTGCRRNQTLQHAVIILLEQNQTRERRALLSLITERGINRIIDRLANIGIGIHDHCVLAAHLANDTLEFALTGSSDTGRLPNF